MSKKTAKQIVSESIEILKSMSISELVKFGKEAGFKKWSDNNLAALAEKIQKD